MNKVVVNGVDCSPGVVAELRSQLAASESALASEREAHEKTKREREAAEASAERLAAGLRTIADRPCHEIRERGNHILWCPDHMPGGRANWCDSCEARAVLVEVEK